MKFVSLVFFYSILLTFCKTFAGTGEIGSGHLVSAEQFATTHWYGANPDEGYSIEVTVYSDLKWAAIIFRNGALKKIHGDTVHLEPLCRSPYFEGLNPSVVTFMNSDPQRYLESLKVRFLYKDNSVFLVVGNSMFLSQID